MLLRDRRTGFTLTEMLIVVVIVLLLATFLVPITLRMQERDNTARAARLVQGALLQARARAANERQVTGVRLLRAGATAEWMDQLEFIRDPGDFTDGWVYGPDAVDPFTGKPLTPEDPLFRRVISGAGATASFTFQGMVQPGDFIEFNGGGQLYEIVAFDMPPSPAPVLRNKLRLNRPIPLGQDIPPPPSGLSNYRIIRKPRPVPGEELVQLPDKTGIHITRCSPVLAPGAEILFSPSGRVVGPAASYDMVFLWVEDLNTIRGVDQNAALVVIYTKTGGVLTFPVDWSSGDPYSFGRTGRGGGGL